MHKPAGIFIVTLLTAALVAADGVPAWSQTGPAAAVRRTSGPADKFIKQPLWIILTKDRPGVEPPAKLRAAHLARQSELEKRGIMFGGGPVYDDKGVHEYGMIIVRAANAAEAKRIADGDPYHAAGTRTYTLHEWSVNAGHMTISINFLDGKASFK